MNLTRSRWRVNVLGVDRKPVVNLGQVSLNVGRLFVKFLITVLTVTALVAAGLSVDQSGGSLKMVRRDAPFPQSSAGPPADAGPEDVRSTEA